jgi:hypothetical protein
MGKPDFDCKTMRAYGALMIEYERWLGLAAATGRPGYLRKVAQNLFFAELGGRADACAALVEDLQRTYVEQRLGGADVGDAYAHLYVSLVGRVPGKLPLVRIPEVDLAELGGWGTTIGSLATQQIAFRNARPAIDEGQHSLVHCLAVMAEDSMNSSVEGIGLPLLVQPYASMCERFERNTAVLRRAIFHVLQMHALERVIMEIARERYERLVGRWLGTVTAHIIASPRPVVQSTLKQLLGAHGLSLQMYFERMSDVFTRVSVSGMRSDYSGFVVSEEWLGRYDLRLSDFNQPRPSLTVPAYFGQLGNIVGQVEIMAECAAVSPLRRSPSTETKKDQPSERGSARR